MPPDLDPSVRRTQPVPRLAFLADGGLWNNLGTQVALEDGFLGQHTAWEDGVLRPFSPRVTLGMPLMVVNGSAAARPSRPGLYQIPGLGVVYALVQSTRVLNTNTVVPRELAMRRAFWRRVATAQRSDSTEAVELVVDLDTPGMTRMRYAYPWDEELIRASDQVVQEWEQMVLGAARAAAKHGTWQHLRSLLEEHPEPQGSYPVPGFANIDDWDSVVGSDAWNLIAEQEQAAGVIRAPTTLNRVDSAVALVLTLTWRVWVA
jgi:hypothetical protein